MDKNQKNYPKIGIGVTTTPNRKKHIEFWYKQFEKFKPNNYHLHIHTDEHYRGVAYSKNQNLKALKDNDFIFLFDDDCYPIKNGWAEYCISSNENHLLYLQPTHGILAKKGEMEYYYNCGGVFMFMTKKAIDTVGYFNPDYGQYGFEHAGYSNRIYKAGLTKYPYQQLKEINKYLFAIDYDGDIFCLKHKSSISEETKQEQIKYNREIFIKEVNSNKIFYNFEK